MHLLYMRSLKITSISYKWIMTETFHLVHTGFIHIRGISALMGMWTITSLQFCFCDSTIQRLPMPFVESSEVQPHSEHLRHYWFSLPSSGVSSTTTLSLAREGCSCMSSEKSTMLPGRRTVECVVGCGLVSGSLRTESLGICQPERSTLCTHASEKQAT